MVFGASFWPTRLGFDPRVVLLVACGKPEPPAPTARGSLLLAPRRPPLLTAQSPPEDFTVGDVDKAEVAEVGSPAVLAEVKRSTGYELAPRALSVTRRKHSRLIEVAVRDVDPARALLLCKSVVQEYVRRRLELDGLSAPRRTSIVDPCTTTPSRAR
jgi:hypothetical protein